ALSGLDEDDVTAYVAEAGYDDEELARALASVTGGNPFFLIEAAECKARGGAVAMQVGQHRRQRMRAIEVGAAVRADDLHS
ncbi:hypothetical protein BST36_30940, partial [Mycolicibacterium moriokaense]|uniref:hypothetical protein n=1 Tax=Mycolicibacterium moriokaense TaxID=39691 RepID=UPI000A0AE7D6